MNVEAFEIFLKRMGKKKNAVERNIKGVKNFNDYLRTEKNKELEEVTKEDLKAFVEKIERAKKSSKGSLYVLMNYFKFTQNNELLKCAGSLREERTRKARRIFPIREFLDIDQANVKKLEKNGIKNVEEMLEAGKTKKQREQLAKQINIQEEAIFELVKLSDLTRLGYVKAKLTRLYFNSGLDSPQKIAKFEPNELHSFFVRFVEESGWDGMIPNPKDLMNNIKNAKKLKKVVED